VKNMVKKCVSLLAVAVILGLCLWGGSLFFRENFLWVDGRILWRHSKVIFLEGHDPAQLDFLSFFDRLEEIDARGSGLTTDQYDRLHREYPNVRIHWEVPFQRAFYPSDTAFLRLEHLSEEDVLQLDYFTGLTSVDGWDCEDYAGLASLQRRRPDCKVFYDVPICGRNWDCDVPELQLRSVDMEELTQRLDYLPNVRSVHLSGKLPPMAAVQCFLDKYPHVAFSWQVDVGEAVLELGASRLDLSGIPQENTEEIEGWIPYLPALEEVDLTNCGLPLGDLMLLTQRYPEIRFVYNVNVGPVTVSTAASEIDLSGHSIEDPALVEAVLPCFRDLKKVVMCDCGISSEEMDALDKRYPDIRFVWSVNIAGLKVRTDATYFYPTRYDVDVSDRDLKELRYCVDMICVDVGHMHGVTNCSWAAYMPDLKYLILADTNVRSIEPLAGLNNLVFLELFLTRVSDYSPLLECPALEDLNLGYTRGNPEPVTRITWLKRLWWPGCWSAKVKYGDVFRENIPGCVFNFDTESSTGEGWRRGRHYYAMRDLLGASYMTW